MTICQFEDVLKHSRNKCACHYQCDCRAYYHHCILN